MDRTRIGVLNQIAVAFGQSKNKCRLQWREYASSLPLSHVSFKQRQIPQIGGI